jgi:D-sedoheptulose 7-phosphate isomerase
LKDYFEQHFNKSIKVKKECLEQGFSDLYIMAEKISKSILSSGKLLLCGNGGSAADAQHLAAELLVRLRPNINRAPISAIALSLDISTITACGNDYSFDDIFERNLRAIGRPGDCLLAISTSGNSNNIINAMKAAPDLDIHVFGFLGKGGGQCLTLCENAFLVPSDDTAAIQESHITAGHALMEAVEDNILDGRLP